MRLAATLALLVLAVLSAAFFFMRERTFTYRFSEPELRERLDQQLPWSEQYFLVFDVELANPRVDLVEGSDRVAGGIDATVTIDIGDNPRSMTGGVDLSGGVRYERAEGAFYLTDPQVEAVEIAGILPAYTNKANDAISAALRSFYRSRPIYELSGEEASKVAARLLLEDVTVEDEHLVVTLSLDRSGGEDDENIESSGY